MAVGKTTKEFLSAVYKNKDKKALRSVRDSQFASEDEVAIFRRLTKHVAKYQKFPSKTVLQNRIKLPYVQTGEPVSFYLDNFIAKAKFNLIKRNHGDLTEAMASLDVEAAEKIIETISTGIRSMRGNLGGAVKTFDEIAEEVIADYRIAQFSGGMRGITCGWPEIDLQTGGYQDGDVVTWVARLGRGKTMLLLHQALASAMAGHRTMFVSPEVPDVQLVRRMIGMITGYNPKLIARGQLSSDLHRNMIETIERIRGQLPITFAAGKYKKTMPFVRSMYEEIDPAITMIDASYLVTPEKRRTGSGSRREVISDVAEEIKDFAAETNHPVVHTVQFNRTAVRSDKKDEREQRSRRDPLAHLDVHKIGETDVIAQISSLVFVAELGDPPHAHDQRYIGIKKGREGEDGFWKINYKFNPVDLSVISNGSENQTPSELDEDSLDAEI